MRATLSLLILLALSACPPAGTTSAVCALAQAAPVVSAVRIEGLARVPEAEVRSALKLKVGSAFSPEALETDRRAVLALGYFRSVTAEQRPADTGIQAIFRVVEWPVVLHVRVTGNTVVERPAITSVLSTRPGQVLRSPRLLQDIQNIQGLYRERGYVAQVSERLLDEAAGSGIVRFEILEVRIGEVMVEGATEELRRRARRALQEDAGELYRPEAVGRDQGRLLQVRGVQSAHARVEPLEPGKVRLRWRLNAPPEPPRDAQP